MRNISIFISSTFIDMQAERDYIKKIIIPQLQHYFSDKNINIYAIDLRWGINTASVNFDEAREAKVLDVCFNTIRNNRPYFIGLIGGRYGWIPSKEQQIKTYSLFSDEDDFMRKYTDNRSVTEMEMLYGALGKNEFIHHSYFFFRSNTVYEQMPQCIREKYVDNDPEKKHKLQQLKNKIYATCRQNDCCENIFEYTPKYDPEKCQLTCFEEFGQKLTQVLIEDISRELQVSQSSLTQQGSDMYLQRKASKCCGRKGIIDELLLFIRNFNHNISNPIHGWILCGASGCGKTTIMSKVYSEVNKWNTHSQYLILTHIVGLTKDSLSYWDMVIEWNRELEQRLNVYYEEEDTILRFEKLLMYAVVNGYKPVVFIDTYDKFQKGDLHFHHIPSIIDKYKVFSSLSFIPRFIPFICTSIKEYLDEDILSNTYFKIYDIEDYSYEDANELIKYSLKGKELSQNALTLLLSKYRTDGKPSYSNPIWINIAMALLDEMGTVEFSEISNDSAIRDDQKIENYICNFINNFSAEPEKLFQQFISLGMEYFSKDIILTTTKLLAISKFGVSEYEIERFLSDKWDPLDFSHVIKWLSPFVEKETITNTWNIAHDILKHSIVGDADIDYFRRQYALSLLPISCYNWRTLKECLSIIVSLNDLYLFRQAMTIFDFLYSENDDIELSEQKIVSAIILQVGNAKLSSIIAESAEKFMNDNDYFSDLSSFIYKLEKEHESQDISDDDYVSFYWHLYKYINNQIKIDCNNDYFNYILKEIYRICVIKNDRPLTNRYTLYFEYIEMVKKKHQKYGPKAFCYNDVDLKQFYNIVLDYITQGMSLHIYAGLNENEQAIYNLTLKHRLTQISNEIDWLILLTALTPEDVERNGNLLNSVLSSIVSNNSGNWFIYTNIPVEFVYNICCNIRKKSHSNICPLDYISDNDVLYVIGLDYFNNRLYQEAYYFFSKVTKKNQAIAENKIGDMYYYGDLEQNIDRAVEWYTKSAQHGNRYAQYTIGVFYEKGIGVAQNYDLAKKWYFLSAQQGYFRAQEKLGDIYSGGLGTKTDYELASKSYFQAALRCSSVAQYRLGVMLMEGIGIKADKYKAVFWLNIAKKAENKWAIKYLEQYQCESKLFKSQKDNVKVEHPYKIQFQHKLMNAISRLRYNTNDDILSINNQLDMKILVGYLILHFINYENLCIRYKSHCFVNWPLTYIALCNSMTFTEDVLMNMKHLYIFSRKCRAFIQDNDTIGLFENKLLSYFLKKNLREDARRLVFEKLELAFRFSFPNNLSTNDPNTIFYLFIVNNKLYNSTEELVAIYEMLQSTKRLTEHKKGKDGKESEELFILNKTKSKISFKSPDEIIARCGYCNANGDVVLPFEYEYASFFYKGEALICKNNQWYYINHAGENVRGFYGLSINTDYDNETYGGTIIQRRIQQINSIFKNGSADEQYYVAEILYDKLNFCEEAAKMYESAARAGHLKAQLSIGYMYYKGCGVECDYQKAIYWFQKGASQGEEMCKYWLKELACI